MSNWNSIVVTKKGRALYAKCLQGATLALTKFKLGDGKIAEGNIEDLNDLVNPVQEVVISALTIKDDGYAEVNAIVVNSELDKAYHARELGLYANDPEDGEILYCYASDENPDLIPSKNTAITISEEFAINIAVDSRTTVTADVAPIWVMGEKQYQSINAEIQELATVKIAEATEAAATLSASKAAAAATAGAERYADEAATFAIEAKGYQATALGHCKTAKESSESAVASAIEAEAASNSATASAQGAAAAVKEVQTEAEKALVDMSATKREVLTEIQNADSNAAASAMAAAASASSAKGSETQASISSNAANSAATTAGEEANRAKKEADRAELAANAAAGGGTVKSIDHALPDEHGNITYNDGRAWNGSAESATSDAKGNAIDTYYASKTEVDIELALKANVNEIYSKIQMDTALVAKASIATANTFAATNTFNAGVLIAYDQQKFNATSSGNLILNRESLSRQSMTIGDTNRTVQYWDYSSIFGAYRKTIILDVYRGGTGTFGIESVAYVNAKTAQMQIVGGVLPDIAVGELITLALDIDTARAKIFIHIIGRVTL